MHDKWAKNAAKDPCNWALMKDPVEAISYHTFPFVPDRTRVELVIAFSKYLWRVVFGNG